MFVRLLLVVTGVFVRVLRPPNYMMNFMLLAALAMVAGLAYVKRDSLEFLFQRTTWACIVIAFILVMMSGQMWNQIRGAGFAHRDPRTGAVVSIPSSSAYSLLTCITSGLSEAILFVRCPNLPLLEVGQLSYCRNMSHHIDSGVLL